MFKPTLLAIVGVILFHSFFCNKLSLHDYLRLRPTMRCRKTSRCEYSESRLSLRRCSEKRLEHDGTKTKNWRYFGVKGTIVFVNSSF